MKGWKMKLTSEEALKLLNKFNKQESDKYWSESNGA